MTKSEAAKTASEALSEIVLWSRVTAFAALAAAGLLLLMAGGAGYVLFDYWRLKTAAAEMSQRFVDERLKAGGHRPLFSPVAGPKAAGR